MIGFLPSSLNVNGTEYPIKTDYRIALIIFQALNDPNLTDDDKGYIVLDSLYGFDNLQREDYEQAIKKAFWYLDGGKEYKKKESAPRLIDWEQDESMIFSAVNKVAGKETREQPYIHWWTWLGYFNEIGEGLLSEVLLIRQKKAKGKKLTEIEKEFEAEHKEIVQIKEHLSDEDEKRLHEEEAYLNALLGGG